MKDGNQPIDYFQLIPKYLSGNASDSEVKLLEDWVLSSSENKDQFNAFKKAWILSGIEGNPQQIDVDQEWQSVSSQLLSDAKVVPLERKPLRRAGLFLRIAAAAAVLLLAVWIFQWLNKGDYMEVVTENEIEENQLPDGTQIAVNQYSSVKYEPTEDEKYRRVELSGDVFFEVERDTASPFVITAEDIEIEVLGTAFYVDAREDQSQIQVIVQSGTVAMTAGSNKVILSADEIGIYDKSTGDLIEKPNKDVNYMAWKTELLRFDHSSLESVVFDLNRKFHSNISIVNLEIKNCEITAIYDHKSLESIVKIIEKTLNIKSEKVGEEIIFSGGGCE